jgi:hypothetical protein
LHDPADILGALSRQIYEKWGNNYHGRVFHELYVSHRTKRDPATLEELEKALRQVFEDEAGTSFIILDGLDEYLTLYSDIKIEKLLHVLCSLGQNVKLLVTSRVLGAMDKIFSRYNAIREEIHAFLDDIISYIRTRIASGSFAFLLSPELSEEVVTRVSEMSKGRLALSLFLYGLSGSLLINS